VIIPVYNGEKTIQETIESVLNQTFSNFELIVINDGSQDSTLDILARIQDSRLKVFSYPNAGLSASRNRGISHACGEFIAFLDADDLWTPDKLEAQLKAMEANPKAVLAYSWTDFIDESGQLLERSIYHTVTGDVFAELLVHNFVGSGSNPLIRKQAFADLGGFDESLTAAEDWDMYLRLAARYQFVAIPSPQVLYRFSDTSMSSNVLRQEAECLKVIERAFAQAPESLQVLKKHSLANLHMYLVTRALGGTTVRRKGLIATRFLWCALREDPSTLQQKQFVLTLLFKIVTAILLPSRQAQALRTNVKSLMKRITEPLRS
jgi:glycosyltransferase involved in cell wall biosynthesis